MADQQRARHRGHQRLDGEQAVIGGLEQGLLLDRFRTDGHPVLPGLEDVAVDGGSGAVAAWRRTPYKPRQPFAESPA